MDRGPNGVTTLTQRSKNNPPQRNNNVKDTLFILLQVMTPQHLLSRLVGWFADTKISWIKGPFIDIFIRVFNVDMTEALDSNPKHYACFNDFFCRALKSDVRPIDHSALCVSPADGTVSQAGKIQGERIFQAKGRWYSTTELLGGNQRLAEHFLEGEFATIYLAPKDYHRLHMPIDGRLLSMTHVPGDLFSVNPATANNIDALFARNERLICVFDTPSGKIALILVGAMIVASIETTWAGLVAPAGKTLTEFDYQAPPINLRKGEEFARFKLGSTIIMLAQKNSLAWLDNINAGQGLRMGQAIAQESAASSSTVTPNTEEIEK